MFLKLVNFHFHLSVLHYLWEKLKMREICKGSHKKNRQSFQEQYCRAMNHTILSYFFFLKHVIEAKRAQELPLGQAHALVLTGIQVGVHTSLKYLI